MSKPKITLVFNSIFLALLCFTLEPSSMATSNALNPMLATCTHVSTVLRDLPEGGNFSANVCDYYSGFKSSDSDFECYDLEADTTSYLDGSGATRSRNSISCQKLHRADCACFPENARVLLESGEFRLMDDLRIGDKVLTGYHSKDCDRNTEPVWESVLDIPHRIPGVPSEFVRIEYASRYTGLADLIELSADHLIYVDSVANYFKLESKPTFARDIKVGDLLWSKGRTVKVIAAYSAVSNRGLYSPHTESGKLIIFSERGESGVQVSCYSHVTDPEVAHRYFSWRRALFAPKSIEEQPIRDAGQFEEWVLYLAKQFMGSRFYH